MKKLITLLLVLVSINSYTQNVYHKKFTSFDEGILKTKNWFENI